MKVILKNCNMEFQRFHIDIVGESFTIPCRVNVPSGDDPFIYNYQTAGQLPENAWCYSAQVDVSEFAGKTVKLNTLINSVGAFGIAFFNGTPSDNTIMASSSVINPISGEEVSLSAVIPASAKYMWFTSQISYLDDVNGSIE